MRGGGGRSLPIHICLSSSSGADRQATKRWRWKFRSREIASWRQLRTEVTIDSSSVRRSFTRGRERGDGWRGRRWVSRALPRRLQAGLPSQRRCFLLRFSLHASGGRGILLNLSSPLVSLPLLCKLVWLHLERWPRPI